MLRVGWRSSGYMVREELKRKILRARAGIRAWGYVRRLEQGRGSGIARRCCEEWRGRESEREDGEVEEDERIEI